MFNLKRKNIRRVAALMLLSISVVASAQISNAATETTLPLQFDTGNPTPYGAPSTFITIQGKKMPILLDTGAKKTGLALTVKALKNIHYTFTGKEVCFKALDGQHCKKEFVIPQLEIGSFVIKNVEGILITGLWGGNDKDFHSSEASDNGVLGFALLSKFNLLLDYPAAQAVLVKPGYQPTNYNTTAWTSLPFTGHLLTRLYLNGKQVILGWDTGAIPSVIRQTTAQYFDHSSCPQGAPYTKKNCLSVVTTSLTTPNQTQIPNTWFRITEIPSYAPFDGLIGSNFYKDNLVYFNLDNHKIYITPAPHHTSTL